MSQAYHITDVGGKHSRKELADFLAREGQWLLPMVELVEQAQCAIDEVVDVMGRATIEAVLQMSAEQAYGPTSGRARRMMARSTGTAGRRGVWPWRSGSFGSASPGFARSSRRRASRPRRPSRRTRRCGRMGDWPTGCWRS